MPVDPASVGRTAEPFVRSWTEKDTLLYALAVGAGQADPLAELSLTTENSAGHLQQVVPSFVLTVIQTKLGERLPFGDYPRGALVHAEQELRIHEPLPPVGSMRVTARISDIQDKGSGALVRMEAVGSDTGNGRPLVTTRLGYFVRGQGGFGGAVIRSEPWRCPEGEPSLEITTPTRPDQALLYRLCGDRNPLHSDPEFAAAAGFRRPILHGLCTYGVVTRELLRVCCDGDAARFGGLSARFTKPVYPGDTLTTALWRRGKDAFFRTTSSRGDVVLDRGVFTYKHNEE